MSEIQILLETIADLDWLARKKAAHSLWSVGGLFHLLTHGYFLQLLVHTFVQEPDSQH